MVEEKKTVTLFACGDTEADEWQTAIEKGQAEVEVLSSNSVVFFVGGFRSAGDERGGGDCHGSALAVERKV